MPAAIPSILSRTQPVLAVRSWKLSDCPRLLPAPGSAAMWMLLLCWGRDPYSACAHTFSSESRLCWCTCSAVPSTLMKTKFKDDIIKIFKTQKIILRMGAFLAWSPK